jgi:kynurenine formamidase
VHTALLRNNVILIENLKNLDQLIGRHFLFSCLPLNIKSGDGSPVRAVAMLEA